MILDPQTTQFTKQPSTPVDVLVITALPEERDAFLRCKDEPGIPEGGWLQLHDKWDFSYYQRSFQREDGTSFTVAAASARQIGEQAATTAATRLVSTLEPRCLAMVGICAGNREEDIHLGDLIVADRVFDFEFGKLKAYYTKRQGHQEEVYHDLTTYCLHPLWLDRFNNLTQNPINWINSISQENKRPKTYEHQKGWLLHRIYEHQKNPDNTVSPKDHPDRKQECPDWEQTLRRLWRDKLLTLNKLELTEKALEEVKRNVNLDTEEKDPELPRVHLGAIGTSKRVQRDPKLFQYLKKVQCRALGVEMEGNAIGAVASELSIPWMIVVKGVADYADHSKNNQFHSYAAEASARFLIAFLKKHLPPTN